MANNKMADEDTRQLIYIVKLNDMDNVYKIGVTKQAHARRPNKTTICIYKRVCNADLTLKRVATDFKKRFIYRIDIGYDLFEGRYVDMEEVFIKAANECDELAAQPVYVPPELNINEIFKTFMDECIVTGKKCDKIKRNEIWTYFKQWHQQVINKKMLITMSDLFDAMNKQYSNNCKGTFWINIRINYQYDDSGDEEVTPVVV